jgi:purine-nucleoside phosphorylase
MNTLAHSETPVTATYAEAAATVRGRTRHSPTHALVLGSGLSGLADLVEEADVIPYGEIPGFPVSTVAGHAGRLVIGRIRGVSVCVMQGRFHFYEGYTMQQVTFPMRVFHLLGVHTMLVTNAAGGLNPAFQVGDLMLIEDNINFPGMAGFNPLRGANDESFGVRFPATNRVYTPALRQLAIETAAEAGIPLRRGVYAMLAGPNFESPAEIRMWRTLGADVVGMSTVPEALVAHHAGMQVLAISSVTNLAIDELDATGEPTHEEVVEAGRIIVPRLSALLLALLGRMA